MRKRIISLFLTLVMLLSFMPSLGITAKADGGWKVVNSYAELKTALEGGSANIRLGKNINTSDEFPGGLTEEEEIDIGYGEIEDPPQFKLDLNGKKLTLWPGREHTHWAIIIHQGSLVIQDTVGGGEIALRQTASEIAGLIFVNEKASFTLESGALTAVASGLYPRDTTLIKGKGNTSILGGELYCAFSDGKIGKSASAPPDAPVKVYFGRCRALYIDFGEGGADKKLVLRNATVNKGYVDADIKDHTAEIKGGVFNSPTEILFSEPPNKEWTEPVIRITGATFQELTLECGDVYDTPTVAAEISDSNFKDLSLLVESGSWIVKAPEERGYLPYRFTSGICGKLKYGISGEHKDINSLYPVFTENFQHLLDSSYIQIGDEIYTSGNLFYILPQREYADGSPADISTLIQGPLTVIPGNGWDKVNVRLDDQTIYAQKDWTGVPYEVKRGESSSLTFQWNPIPQKMKDAGYTYDIRVSYHYPDKTEKNEVLSSSATRHVVDLRTMPLGLSGVDLQLNLKKDGKYIAPMANEHIVRLRMTDAEAETVLYNGLVKMSGIVTPGGAKPTAAAAGSNYTVASISWYQDKGCTTAAGTFAEGKDYYAKIVLQPAKNHVFSPSATGLAYCDDPNDNYNYIASNVVAGDGSSLTFVVKGTAVAPFRWESADQKDQSYALGSSSLALRAKAVGGDASKPIAYKLMAEKDGVSTVKASGTVPASSADSFTAFARFTELGNFRCWFEAKRGDVVITSPAFTVTATTPGMTISNQSGDMTVQQDGTARLFVIAKGYVEQYQWQVKEGNSWKNVADQGTFYDYRAPTDVPGEKVYRCMISDKEGKVTYTKEMKVTVLENSLKGLTPIIPLAAVNGDAPDPETLWPDKRVPTWYWHKREVEYNVNAGDIFHGVATFSTIPQGYTMISPIDGSDFKLYYDSYAEKPETPVQGNITYEWKGTTVDYWHATSSDFTHFGTEPTAEIPIPTDVDTYYVWMTVQNTIGEGNEALQQSSTVVITFHIGDHNYAYAELDETHHTKYCIDCDASTTEPHTMVDGICTLCGYAPAGTHKVNVTNGSASPAAAAAGTKITLTADPAPEGQEFDRWVGNVAVTGNTFTMPDHNVTVAAVYKTKGSAGTHPFTDVEVGSWYEEAVVWAVGKGITSGISETAFAPDGICTRAQAVTFLWRAAGMPAPKTTVMPFTDVPKDSYYYDAVLWAVENGITGGTGNNQFSPNMNCSRAQIVTFLWRVEEAPDAHAANPFADVKADAYYAMAVLWAVEENITKGITDTAFAPDNNCTRAQIVTFIHRYMEN